MVVFLKNYGGAETDYVKYRRGGSGAFHPWQEAALTGSGIAKKIKSIDQKAPKPVEAPAKGPKEKQGGGGAAGPAAS